MPPPMSNRVKKMVKKLLFNFEYSRSPEAKKLSVLGPDLSLDQSCFFGRFSYLTSPFPLQINLAFSVVRQARGGGGGAGGGLGGPDTKIKVNINRLNGTLRELL